ncbi:hypothetical protein Palpr_2772 [Paludibacter propionicigenes WB4]|uniref:PpiC domain-containing protein n=1 Tax=Paludibacter propionicigenes (strain DSM 17365 / JCM 13257 / WB4) TaxID=694427 RepID=E4T857_PALPW|nr:peptidyl-prolyl cis-trans isomerase [Paludibacter propionicigenes]ADQ80901.1 hypothetical protein Palpr_2772 [Paludibacter propionicigenes WB4]
MRYTSEPQCFVGKSLFHSIFLISLLGFILLIESCTGYGSNDTLLQIGDYKVTVADYEYMRNENNERYKLTDADLKKKIIDEGYINAYALENKYDTIASLKTRLDYAIRFYAAVQDGYMWNKKYKQALVVSETQLREAYEKQKLEYNIEFILFPDKGLLDKYCSSHSAGLSSSDFNSIKSRIGSKSGVYSSSTYQRYPFNLPGLDYDKLIQCKKGDVWGPVQTPEGYFIYRMVESRNTFKVPYNTLKPNLQKILEHKLAQKYDNERKKEVLQKAKPVMSDETINYMLSVCDMKARKWNYVDRSKVLMNYSLDGKTKAFTIADFIGFVENEPLFFGSLTQLSGIKGMLESNILDIYLYSEALKIGMLNDPEFLTFKRNRQFKIYTQHYKETNVIPKVVVTEAESRKFYNQNIDKFKTFGSCEVLIYKFKDSQTAGNSMPPIAVRYTQKPVPQEIQDRAKSIKIPEPTPATLKISDKTLSANIKSAIIRLMPTQVSMPIQMNNGYWVIYLKSKSDLIIIPYEEVKSEIAAKLPEILSNQILEQQISKLKLSYKIKTDKIDDYLTEKGKAVIKQK